MYNVLIEDRVEDLVSSQNLYEIIQNSFQQLGIIEIGQELKNFLARK